MLHMPDARDGVEVLLAYLEHAVLAQAAPLEEVAAVLVEPIQGEGSYIVPPEGSLRIFAPQRVIMPHMHRART